MGWLDAVLLKYAVRVNGLTELALTKLDILTGLDPIRICIAYRSQAGEHREPLFGASHLAEYEPIYEELPGWQAELTEATRLADFPAQARAYIERVQSLAGVQVRQVSMGPAREQLVRID